MDSTGGLHVALTRDYGVMRSDLNVDRHGRHYRVPETAARG